jgi:hypothetical protein
LTAFQIAQRALPERFHINAPRKFTTHQLLACLVLKEFMKRDFRGLSAMLADCPDLAGAIGLKAIPHWTTFQKAEARLLKITPASMFFTQIIATMFRGRRVPLVALDSTGLEAHHTSHYFVRRRANNGKDSHSTTYRRFPKLGLICDCHTHGIISAVALRGPSPDHTHFREALWQAHLQVRPRVLLADAGYDSEGAHVFAREELGIRSIIPSQAGRPTIRPPTGRWRRVMARRFDHQTYGQRWQVETVASMLKRNLGSALRARHYWSQCREMILRALTHNVMILLP